MMRHDPGRGIDGEGHDLFGPRARNLLDVHPARGRSHEGDARAFAVDERREIELAVDGRTFLDIEAVDLLTVRAGLMGDEHRAEQALGLLAHVLLRLDQLDAAGLAAPAGVDLRLDDEQRRAEIARSLDRLLDRKRRMPARHRHAEFPQHRLGLIFVDVHADPYLSRMQRTRSVYALSASLAALRLWRAALPRFARDTTILTSPDWARSSCKPRPALRRPRPTLRTWHVRRCSTESRRCARRPSRRSRRVRRHKG